MVEPTMSNSLDKDINDAVKEYEEALIHNMEPFKKPLASDTPPKKPPLFSDSLEAPVYAIELAKHPARRRQ